MIQDQRNQIPAGTQMSQYSAMFHPMIIQNDVQAQPSPVFNNQPQYHQSLPLIVTAGTTTNPSNSNSVSASSTPTDEVLSVPSSLPTQVLTPTMLPYNPHLTISPVSTGLCSPTIVSMDNLQTAWIAPGSNLNFAPQARLFSPTPSSFVPYAPVFTQTPPPPPPMTFEAFRPNQPYQNPAQQPIYPNNNIPTAQEPAFSSPQLNRNETPSPPRSNHQFQNCHNNAIFPEENVKKAPTRHCFSTKGGLPMSRNRKNFRIRCKACSAPVSRQVVKEVKQEDLESAFADQNEILDQLPEFFGEPLLNFPEIVFYMQIFKAKSKENEELQYFKVPRPAKERELHIDHRLTELFIRNFGFDHACEHHEFKRLPMHQPGICHARNLYRQLIVDSLLPTFLAYVRNMDEAKRLFGIIFRYVGCATPRDISSNLPQVWKAVTSVDSTTNLEITGIVSLYNYHLFRRLIEKENEKE